MDGNLNTAAREPLRFGGVDLEGALAALRTREPHARAFWLTDLDAFGARSRRLREAFAPITPHVALALKANGLPSLARAAERAGLDADAGSLGELELARAAGFPAARRTLSGNGRTPEEAAWVASFGVDVVSADHVGELDLLQREASRAGTRVRVAMRVNPGIATDGHPHVATGHDEAKFGVAPAEALAAWSARARWPNLQLDGVHLHVGSQLLDATPLLEAARTALALADESAARGAPLALVNLGGGLGIDYEDPSREFPLGAYVAALGDIVRSRGLAWRIEPGRWLTAPVGVLVAEVLWVKQRHDRDGERRFVVLAAGMNDLLRPALYGARHRIEPVRARAGAPEPATIVGPVCESGDTFARDVLLPPLEPGDLVVLRDAGAYGAAMSSNYNGRGRLAELVIRDGRLTRARAGETPAELLARDLSDRLSP